jgi:hypothetical protein
MTKINKKRNYEKHKRKVNGEKRTNKQRNVKKGEELLVINSERKNKKKI